MMYSTVMERFQSVAIHMAVSAVSRGKSNCAKLAIAAVGNFPSGYTVHLTKSMSRSYLGGGLPFLYDDPSNVDVLKEMLIDAFGGARMSDQHKDQTANCTPLITANEFLVDDLSKADERYSCHIAPPLLSCIANKNSHFCCCNVAIWEYELNTMTLYG